MVPLSEWRGGNVAKLRRGEGGCDPVKKGLTWLVAAGMVQWWVKGGEELDQHGEEEMGNGGRAQGSAGLLGRLGEMG
jgi:hypothetical protein